VSSWTSPARSRSLEPSRPGGQSRRRDLGSCRGRPCPVRRRAFSTSCVVGAHVRRGAGEGSLPGVADDPPPGLAPKACESVRGRRKRVAGDLAGAQVASRTSSRTRPGSVGSSRASSLPRARRRCSSPARPCGRRRWRSRCARRRPRNERRPLVLRRGHVVEELDHLGRGGVTVVEDPDVHRLQAVLRSVLRVAGPFSREVDRRLEAARREVRVGVVPFRAASRARRCSSPPPGSFSPGSDPRQLEHGGTLAMPSTNPCRSP